ncbi:alpha/beta fold hydrolase [Variovorax sp. LT1R16]|uniref:alpha/beta fold hydrolase n=1 Tax=Variovorax sp. LT1R16 TaxID=3443728 RepID=UPI003F4866D7
MKFFTALFANETNTFVSAPTGQGSFEAYGIFRGDASTRDATGYGMFAVEARKQLAAEGHEMVESLLAFAQPLGRIVRPVYERLRDDILDDLRKAGPVDGVILVLHGAMVAEGHDDGEGDLIARVRAIVGPKVTIGVSLDLHCHFTQQMLHGADVIICYKEYPHTDALERLQELIRIVVDTAQGRVKPVTAVHDCRMVGKWHTTREPMAGFVRRMEAAEKLPGVLSVSLGHGFPWADVPESGAKLWVVTDNDPALAAKLAEELGREFWDLRHQTGVPSISVDQALDRAMALPGGPVVIADTADNAGGGATSDSTFVLRAIIERGIADVAFGGVWDLGAVQLCRDAGVGASFALRLGGKCGPASGDPIDLHVTVKAVKDAHSQRGLAEGNHTPMGPCVWVQAANGVDIVLISKRNQVIGSDLFTGLGIDLTAKKLVVVKSAQHFHAEFGPLASAVLYVSTPAALSTDFANLPYRVRDLDYWPRVEDPQRSAPLIRRPHWMPAPGELYSVDGRSMHLQRSGPAPANAAQPTIVIEAGGGCASTTYARLQQALAAKHPVISYDRAGMGWSEADEAPFDGERTARRLHALLEAAGVTGPIVLIGHSIGGLLNRVYAGLYPLQVAGVVMLDASHPEQFAMYERPPESQFAAERDKRANFQAGGPPPPEHAPIEALFADMPQVLVQMKAIYTPEALDATLAEVRGLPQVARQAAASPDFGSRPLAVLWAQQQPLPAGADPALAAVQQRWPEFQEAHAALSTQRRLACIEGAAHMTLVLLPPFVSQVAAAVDQVVAQIEASR